MNLDGELKELEEELEQSIIEEKYNRAWLPRNASPARYNTGEPGDSALSNATGGNLLLTPTVLIFQPSRGKKLTIYREDIVSVKQTRVGIPGFTPHADGFEINLSGGSPSRLLFRVEEALLWIKHLDTRKARTKIVMSPALKAELKSLKELKEQGIIDEEEFKSEKKKLLNKSKSVRRKGTALRRSEITGEVERYTPVDNSLGASMLFIGLFFTIVGFILFDVFLGSPAIAWLGVLIGALGMLLVGIWAFIKFMGG